MSCTWQEAKPVFKLSSAQLLSLWTITCLTPAQSASFNRDQGEAAKEQIQRWRQSRDSGQALWPYLKAPVSMVLSLGRVAVLWPHWFLVWA